MPTAFFSSNEVNLSQFVGYEVPSMVNGVSRGMVWLLCLNMIVSYRAREVLKGDSAKAAHINVAVLVFESAADERNLNPLERMSKL